MDCHGIKIDRSGKDICRLCFVSYDPDMYYTDLYDVFEVPEDYKGLTDIYFNQVQEIDRRRYDASDDAEHVFATCKKWVAESKIGIYHLGNRNNFIHALACSLNRAGMDEQQAVIMIASTYKSLKLNEIQKSIASAYKHNKGEFNTKKVLVKKTNQQKLL